MSTQHMSGQIAVKQEVLPCPFCGIAPAPFQAPGGKFSVVCKNPECGIQPASRFPGGSISPTKAIAAWNTRNLTPAQAAAPELLEALNVLCDVSNGFPTTSQWEAARAAIAKAEGRES